MALCCLLTSCGTLSENPLSSPENSKPDPRLLGTWRDTDDSSSDESYHFTAGKGPWLNLTITFAKKNKKAEHYTLFPTTIGNYTFLNVRLDGTDNHKRPIKGYVFFRYSVSRHHTLSIRGMSNEPFVEAIRKGKLKGVLYSDEKNREDDLDLDPKPDNILIQDSTTNLAHFIQSKDIDDLFDNDNKTNSLKRVGD